MKKIISIVSGLGLLGGSYLLGASQVTVTSASEPVHEKISATIGRKITRPVIEEEIDIVRLKGEISEKIGRRNERDISCQEELAKMQDDIDLLQEDVDAFEVVGVTGQ